MKFYSSKGSLKKNQLSSEKSSSFYPDLISGIHRHRQFKQVSTNLHSRTMGDISTLDTFS